jgi:hypothetical protein
VALFGALCSAALFLAACGDDDGDDDEDDALPHLEGTYASDCKGYTTRMRDCGLLTDGPVYCRDPENETEQCRFDCVTTASCSLLARDHCVGTPPALNRCLTLCDYYTCGDGQMIPRDWICDHDLDCADGGDELGCYYYECGSGALIGQHEVCDGDSDCADSSDETGCPTFTCDDGTVIPERRACDFVLNCLDGSDEANCDRFVCKADGRVLPPSWICDLEDDCLDGEDELGCAQPLCY